MKAYTCRQYGGPETLTLVDIPKPEPNENEILVKIHATSVTSGDCRVRSLEVPAGLGLIARLAIGFRGPRKAVLGTEMAGVVEAVGCNVMHFDVGDAVFAFPGGQMGCYAEYRCIAENGPVVLKPETLSFAEAASLSFGGNTALDFLRKAKVKAGEKILIVGASGGVGTALVQLARHIGATVTGVTSSRNVDLVRSLGAKIVIDYTAETFAERNEQYDVIMDVVSATSFSACKHLLVKKGRYVALAGGLTEMLAMLWAPLLTGKKVIAGPAEERVDDIIHIAHLVAKGVLKPTVDRIYAFDDMVAAHSYVDTGRKRGSVVITLKKSLIWASPK